jgi:hypothetical protein
LNGDSTGLGALATREVVLLVIYVALINVDEVLCANDGLTM